jgi:hypothetical protein
MSVEKTLYRIFRPAEPAEVSAVLYAIDRMSWRFAKSMPQWPHEYTVRSRDDHSMIADYMTLYAAIAAHGVEETFTGTKTPSRKKYLYPGDGWRYWFKNRNPDRSKIINRNRLEDAEKLRAAGLACSTPRRPARACS